MSSYYLLSAIIMLPILYKNIPNEKWPVKACAAAEMGPKSGHCRPGAAGF
jgi:hypothetical protein